MSFEISCSRTRTEGEISTRCLPLAAVSTNPAFIVSKTPAHARRDCRQLFPNCLLAKNYIQQRIKFVISTPVLLVRSKRFVKRSLGEIKWKRVWVVVNRRQCSIKLCGEKTFFTANFFYQTRNLLYLELKWNSESFRISAARPRSLPTLPFQIMSIFSCRHNSYSYCSPIVIQAGAHIANHQPLFGCTRGTFCAVRTNKCVPWRLLGASQLRDDREADSPVDSSGGAGRGANRADPRRHRECAHDTKAQTSDAEGGGGRGGAPEAAGADLWMWFSNWFLLH